MAKEKNYWIKSGILSLSERLSVLLFGFGSLLMLLRMLSKADFGLWVLFLTITSVIEVARTGMLQNALVKYLTTSNSSDYGRIATASLALNILIGLAAALLVLAIAMPLEQLWNTPGMNRLLYIYLITSFLLIPLHQFNFMQQANMDFRGIFLGNLTRQGLFFLVTGFAFVRGGSISLTTLAYAMAVAAAAASGVSWYSARRYLRFSRRIDRQWIGRLFHFGKYVFGTNLSTMLYKSIDKWMLGGLLSPVAVAVYELAIRVTNLAEVPTFSMASIVFPQSARQSLSKGKEGVRTLYEKSVGAILTFTLPGIALVLLFPEWIIWIIAGSQYLDAAPILQLTMLYGLFVPFAVQFGTALDSTGMPQINFFFTCGGALLNVLFNFLFIRHFGLAGAAYGTLLTYLITFCGMQFFLFRKFNVILYRSIWYTFGFYLQALKMARQLYHSKVLPASAVNKPKRETYHE